MGGAAVETGGPQAAEEGIGALGAGAYHPSEGIPVGISGRFHGAVGLNCRQAGAPGAQQHPGQAAGLQACGGWAEGGGSSLQSLCQPHGDPVGHSGPFLEPVGNGKQVVLQQHRPAVGAIDRRRCGVFNRSTRSAGKSHVHAGGDQLYLGKGYGGCFRIKFPALLQLGLTGLHSGREQGFGARINHDINIILSLDGHHPQGRMDYQRQSSLEEPRLLDQTTHHRC